MRLAPNVSRHAIVRALRAVGFCAAAVCPLWLANASQASVISGDGLLVSTTTNVLTRFSFAGVPQETVAITGLPATGVPLGVAVVSNRLFVGVVSPIALFVPSIAEINPVTGAVMSFTNTIVPILTSLGDDGTNLLLLNSNADFDAYRYSTSSTFVSKLVMTRPFVGNIQANGIDSDGTSIFTAFACGNPYPVQPIVTNNATTGAADTYFATNLDPNDPIRGLGYSETDDTFWVGTANIFRQYSRAGSLLNTIPGTSTITGLEVLVPEPSSFALAFVAMATTVASRRKR
jgi:hypothetical protein